MSNEFVFFLIGLLAVFVVHANQPIAWQKSEKEKTPQYLYKILSIDDWKKSQGMEFVKLTDADQEFIHLARQDQLDRIAEKYWNKSNEYIVLKINTSKLPGNLVFESNLGGESKYYHLYNGSIPLNAVFESRIIKNK